VCSSNNRPDIFDEAVLEVRKLLSQGPLMRFALVEREIVAASLEAVTTPQFLESTTRERVISMRYICFLF